MKTAFAVALVALLACSPSSNDAPIGNEPQALTTEVVCQIGPIDQFDPHGGNSTCEQYVWSWSDSAGDYTKCSAQPCVIGNACHIMGGTFGQVAGGACYTADGPKACDASSPWVWIGPSGATSCLKTPSSGAQCWQTVNGVCRLATFN